MNDLNLTARNLSHHINLKKDEWYVAKFRSDEIKFSDNQNLIADLDRYQMERAGEIINGRHTTVQPEQEEITENVILNQGLQLGIDQLIGGTTTPISHFSLGTNSIAAATTQTDLQVELTDTVYARKAFSSSTRTGQILTLATVWDHMILDTAPTTLRETGINWHESDANSCYARAVFSDFPLGTGDILVIRATELNQNGSL